jgi:hypothetical protein
MHYLARKILAVEILFLLIFHSEVSAMSYSISVRTDREAYVAGEFVEISGYVTDQENRSISTFVSIVVLTPKNEMLLSDQVNSNDNGYFSTILSLPQDASIGTYFVTATTSLAAAYTTFSIVEASIDIFLQPNIVSPGDQVLVFGHVYPHRRVEVSLEFSNDNIEWKRLSSTYTNSSGFYSFMLLMSREGNYSIRVSANGVRSNAAKLIVKKPSTISISLSTSEISAGREVVLKGLLDSTCSNATITIEWRSPDGKTFSRTVLADPSGSFQDSFRPEIEGSWSVSASWQGDEFNQPADSMVLELLVKPSPPTMLFISIVAVEDIVVLCLLMRHILRKRRNN